MSETRFHFDSKFIKASLMRLIFEPHLIDKFRDFLNPSVFDIQDEYETIKKISKIVLDKSKNENVTSEAVWAWIQLLPNGPERQATLLQFEEMRLDEDLAKFARSDEVFDTFLQYLKATTFLTTHKEIKESFNKADFEHAYKNFEHMLGKIRTITMDEHRVFDWTTSERFLEDMADTKFKNFDLGIDDFDKDTGFEPQSFNIFIGASGGGKSQMSIHLAVQAVKQGKKAFLTFVEDKDKTIMRRLFACYTGIPIESLKDFHKMPPEFRERIITAKEKFKKFLHVEFVYGQGHKTIIDRVKQENEKLKIEGKPLYEVFVLDYIGHIAHHAAGEKTHEKLHRACSDLKDFALQTGIIVFTHFQSNREGAGKSNEGTGVIDMSTIASSFNSAFVADNIISINRSEEQKMRNQCILYVVKGREGATGRKYEVSTQFDKARFDMKDAKLLTGTTY